MMEYIKGIFSVGYIVALFLIGRQSPELVAALIILDFLLYFVGTKLGIYHPKSYPRYRI